MRRRRARHDRRLHIFESIEQILSVVECDVDELDKNEKVAMELAKLAVSQSKPVADDDVTRLTGELVDVYRYILKDLRERE
jgi:hypothetical protein